MESFASMLDCIVSDIDSVTQIAILPELFQLYNVGNVNFFRTHNKSSYHPILQ